MWITSMADHVVVGVSQNAGILVVFINPNPSMIK